MESARDAKRKANQEAHRQAQEAKQAQRQADRQERNKAQAIEEQSIWAQLNTQADNAVAISQDKRRHHLSKYTEEIAREIATRMSEGQSLAKICKLEHMPDITTIYDWIEKEPFFAQCYARARENAAHTLFDQMIDIADDSSNDLLADGSANNAAIARARLQIETRARVAGKLHARAYGERIEQLNQTVNVTNNTLSIDGRSLGGDQRAALRAMLLQAKDAKTIEG